MIKALENTIIVKFSCGGYHTLALSQDNQFFAWGAGLYGECGFGIYAHSNTPKIVDFFTKGITMEVSRLQENK